MTEAEGRRKRFRKIMIAHPRAESGDLKFYGDPECTEEMPFRIDGEILSEDRTVEIYAKNTGKKLITSLQLETDDPTVTITPSSTWIEPGQAVKLTFVFSEKYVVPENNRGPRWFATWETREK